MIPVLVYASMPTVELFVNGKSYGKKTYLYPRYGMEYDYLNFRDGNTRGVATTNDPYLTWDVPFEPGTVEAVGYELNGTEVCRTKLETTGPAAKLELTCEEKTISADGKDIAQIEVTALDSEGRYVPDAEPEVHVTVSGGAKLLAMDNGDQTSKVSFKSDSRKLMAGKLLVIVQAGTEPGKVKVSVTADGMEPAVTEITAK